MIIINIHICYYLIIKKSVRIGTELIGIGFFVPTNMNIKLLKIIIVKFFSCHTILAFKN